ncbi:MAG: WYL domain-containing protein [Actinobacteria bacterium]|jgi:DNA polymerase III epsilon subunit family exonuclease|nr:MAG: WYL domain-containing protein [Actinomycetota bacterium]
MSGYTGVGENIVFCAVDVETTGLYMGSRLVELGAVRFSPRGVIDEFHTLVDPMEPIQQGAIDIHGITDEMVRGCPRPAEVVEGFASYLGDAVFIAHNARFDVRIIGMELARAGIEPPPNAVVDTVLLARRAFPGMPNYRLGTVTRHLGIRQDCHHRGLPDARAAMEIFLRYLDGEEAVPCLEDTPGFIGAFSRLAPRLELELSGTDDDLYILVEKKVVVEMTYEGGSSPGIPRMITPLHVFGQGENGYLRAYCHRTGMVKTFRLDRVIELRLP